MSLDAGTEKSDRLNSAIASLSQGVVSSVADPFMRDIVIWTRLQKNMDVPLDAWKGFLLRKKAWPMTANFQARFEKEFYIQSASSSDLLGFFRALPPRSAEGKILYLRALKNKNLTKELAQAAKLYWTDTSMTSEQEKEFLDLGGPYLKQANHDLRLQNLIKKQDTMGGKRMMARVSPRWRVIGSACLLFLSPDEKKIPTYETWVRRRGVPELLSWCYMRYLIRTKQYRRVPDVFKHLPKKLEDPLLFYKLRVMSVRELMEVQRYTQAANLMKNHQLTPKDIVPYTDALWHVGWIYAAFLDKPKQAQPYFEKFLKHVKTPISVPRGHYWMGRTYESLHNKKAANTHYRLAAKHKASFYGQLAAHKVGVKPTPKLLALPTVSSAAQKKFESKEQVRALSFFRLMGDEGYTYTKIFLLSLVPTTKTAEAKKALLRLAYAHHPSVTVDIARAFWLQNEPFALLKLSYPLCKLPKIPKEDQAIALAIIYKETRFDTYAIGDAGERGLMQVMPNTAVLEAKKLGVQHTPDKLFEPDHNILLGIAHYKRHEESFTSYPLSISAYNAGGKAVEGWKQRILSGHQTVYGKRFNKLDYYVNLTESIPYDSTRGYVQRFLEAKAIYRDRLGLPFIVRP